MIVLPHAPGKKENQRSLQIHPLHQCRFKCGNTFRRVGRFQKRIPNFKAAAICFKTYAVINFVIYLITDFPAIFICDFKRYFSLG